MRASLLALLLACPALASAQATRAEPGVTLSRHERAPHLPRELRPLTELCREASHSARVLRHLRKTWRSSSLHSYLLHRAYLEIAEHLLRDPHAQLPDACGGAERVLRQR
jgi:hypothetical protein